MQSGQNHFVKLPPELLQYIFSFIVSNIALLQLSRVCKQWHKESRNEFLWKQRGFFSWSDAIKTMQLKFDAPSFNELLKAELQDQCISCFIFGDDKPFIYKIFKLPATEDIEYTERYKAPDSEMRDFKHQKKTLFLMLTDNEQQIKLSRLLYFLIVAKDLNEMKSYQAKFANIKKPHFMIYLIPPSVKNISFSKIPNTIYLEENETMNSLLKKIQHKKDELAFLYKNVNELALPNNDKKHTCRIS